MTGVTFLEKLDFMMKKLNINKSRLSAISGVPYTTIDTFYKKGYENTRLSTVRKLAEALDVSMDYLLLDDITDEHYGKTNGFTVSFLEQTHLKKYRSLDRYGREAVDSVLDVAWRRCEEERNRELRELRDRTGAGEEPPSVVLLPQPYTQVAAAEGSGAFLLDDSQELIAVTMNEYTKQADLILKVVGRSMEPEIGDGSRVLVRVQPSVNAGEIGVFILDGQGYLKQYEKDRLVSLNPDIKDVYIGDFQKAECYGKFISVLDPEWVK